MSVNCGAIPANLVEAELFGYERGAFTGAVRQHQGYFERAAGGTLFLDEITEMPIDLQAKLLRVLESGRMVRVGGTEEIPLDVRIVTATNRPSESAVRDRVLREDLYYRLAVFLVRLPPLRQPRQRHRAAGQCISRRSSIGTTGRRRDSIPLRAGQSPRRIRGRETSASSRTASNAAMCCRTTSSGWTSSLRSTFPDGAGHGDCVRLPIGITMADAERELFLATLRHCGGNKRRTADVLGVSLKTVYNKLLGYGNAAAPHCSRATAGELCGPPAARRRDCSAGIALQWVPPWGDRDSGGLFAIWASSFAALPCLAHEWQVDDRHSAPGFRRR